MIFWETITSNYLLNVGFLSWSAAQIIKTFLNFLTTKAFHAERLVGAGGMPSAHSALVCSLTVAMAKKVGFASPLFALMLSFAAIVMYDAMGVRRAAGEHAKVLNKMVFDFKGLSKDFGDVFSFVSANVEEEDEDEDNPNKAHKELKEFIGHTPLEVLGGALLGILMATIISVK